ncbi:hypothetical protein GKZ90_0006580 [Flavobacterium sp. MC2016-06]|jgi:hypothetical protein|uniref:hypothetical protein n=1 Tax=Flavobacterium sp. MC2016-06 TaxID=2676308 RepID=UPI0012BAB92E|nr:hypothetical protein [Flavobacterium sp. MC2016-06]MBU3857804.1 hypothetical protein [Flavobacterium sp. MC2016-06]
MKEELIDLITKVKNKITDDSNMLWTKYNDPKDLQMELETCIHELKEDNLNSMKIINVLFGPTGDLQEHSISNGWTTEYLELSEKFDDLYKNRQFN